jgi:hypothetical protein
MEADVVAPCAEFPNDNGALHGGAVWLGCVTGPPSSDVPPPAPTCAIEPTPTAPVVVSEPEAALEPECSDAIEVVDELVFDDPPVDDDPFATFVRRLTEVAEAAGSPSIAAELRALLGAARFDGAGLTALAGEALLAGGIVERTAAGLARTARFTAQLHAWQGILRGESEDFSACGPAMLDEWAADLVARALGSPNRADWLKRELRKRGIVGFGLVEAAA